MCYLYLLYQPSILKVPKKVAVSCALGLCHDITQNTVANYELSLSRPVYWHSAPQATIRAGGTFPLWRDPLYTPMVSRGRDMGLSQKSHQGRITDKAEWPGWQVWVNINHVISYRWLLKAFQKYQHIRKHMNLCVKLQFFNKTGKERLSKW